MMLLKYRQRAGLRNADHSVVVLRLRQGQDQRIRAWIPYRVIQERERTVIRAVGNIQKSENNAK